MIEIKESNMVFGPFEESHFFYLEQSKLYKSVGENVKTVEFLYSRDFSAVSFVEAKSSSPRQAAHPQAGDALDEYITDVTNKFLHSFSLYCSALMGRHESSNDIPEGLLHIDASLVKYKFFLVIHGDKGLELAHVREALIKKLRPYRKIWDLKIFVFNDSMAQEYHLVKA